MIQCALDVASLPARLLPHRVPMIDCDALVAGFSCLSTLRVLAFSLSQTDMRLLSPRQWSAALFRTQPCRRTWLRACRAMRSMHIHSSVVL
jgi:hypothetical protein